MPFMLIGSHLAAPDKKWQSHRLSGSRELGKSNDKVSQPSRERYKTVYYVDPRVRHQVM
jgi:hypothetical protein